MPSEAKDITAEALEVARQERRLSWCETKILEFDPCKSCGSIPRAKHIGNDRSKSRTIVVKCPGCRIQRIDGAIHQGFAWLEEVAVRNWNQAPACSPKLDECAPIKP